MAAVAPAVVARGNVAGAVVVAVQVVFLVAVCLRDERWAWLLISSLRSFIPCDVGFGS